MHLFGTGWAGGLAANAKLEYLVTHGYNVGQRFAKLSFTKTSTGLNIVAPMSKVNVPPGCYMLFILNSKGVPSQAKIVKT